MKRSAGPKTPRHPHVWIQLLDPRGDSRLRPRAAAEPTLPLYGLPFAIKDNIDLAGVPTTVACPDFAYIPTESATIVERLIAAGAIPIGKTNLDQFATGLTGTRSPYGAPECVFHSGVHIRRFEFGQRRGRGGGDGGVSRSARIPQGPGACRRRSTISWGISRPAGSGVAAGFFRPAGRSIARRFLRSVAMTPRRCSMRFPHSTRPTRSQCRHRRKGAPFPTGSVLAFCAGPSGSSLGIPRRRSFTSDPSPASRRAAGSPSSLITRHSRLPRRCFTPGHGLRSGAGQLAISSIPTRQHASRRAPGHQRLRQIRRRCGFRRPVPPRGLRPNDPQNVGEPRSPVAADHRHHLSTRRGPRRPHPAQLEPRVVHEFREPAGPRARSLCPPGFATTACRLG